VDYSDYQKVVVTDSKEGIIKAAENYLGGYVGTLDMLEKDIQIVSITSAVLEGTTYYYLKDNDNVYRASIKINENILPFLKSGDKVTIKYKEDLVNQIIEIKSSK